MNEPRSFPLPFMIAYSWRRAGNQREVLHPLSAAELAILAHGARPALTLYPTAPPQDVYLLENAGVLPSDGDQAFFLKEDQHGRLRLHTKLHGSEMAIDVPPRAKTVSDVLAGSAGRSAGAERLQRTRTRVGLAALAATGVAALFLAGTLRHSPPMNETTASQPAMGVRERGSDSAANSPLPAASSKLASPRRFYADLNASTARIVASLAEPARASSQAASVRVITSQPSEVAVHPEAELADPYAGLVAKRLTGRPLRAAIAADRLATKELNLRQLDDIPQPLPYPAVTGGPNAAPSP